MKRSVLAAALATFFCACGGDKSPEELCNEAAEVNCAKLYDCLSEQERMEAGLPENEADCVAQLQEFANCAQATEENSCDTGETYHPDEAEDCLDQIADQSCDEFVQDVVPPACERVCTTE